MAKIGRILLILQSLRQFAGYAPRTTSRDYLSQMDTHIREFQYRLTEKSMILNLSTVLDTPRNRHNRKPFETLRRYRTRYSQTRWVSQNRGVNASNSEDTSLRVFGRIPSTRNGRNR